MKTFAYMTEKDELEHLDRTDDEVLKEWGRDGKEAVEVAGKETDKDQKKERKPLLNISGPTLTLILLLVVFLISVITRLVVEVNPFGWLFGSNGGGGGGLPAEIGSALAPILALALAIERLIETVFDFFESNLKEVAKKTTGAAQSLVYIEHMSMLYTKQMNQAKEALEAAVDSNQPAEVKEKLASAVQRAENLLLEAGNRLDLLPKDPKYVSWKRGISILLGLVMGMVVAVFTDQGVFYYLNFNVPRIIEMLLTGFILGAGSGPLHSLVGILQGAKDALVGLANPNIKGLGDLTRQVQTLSDRVDVNRLNPI